MYKIAKIRRRKRTVCWSTEQSYETQVYSITLQFEKKRRSKTKGKERRVNERNIMSYGVPLIL